MNYAKTQQTGRLAELAVETIFTQWGWTVGRDHIDVGYDHVVEPDRGRFSGARFLVQTKGTARAKKGRIVASVSKARLRQYAVDAIPVFIVRVNESGRLYWVHAQEWCRDNASKLDGDGYAGVVLPAQNILADKATFEEYLAATMAPPETKLGALAGLAGRRSEYLSSLDPRLKVDVRLDPSGKEGYIVSAANPDDQPIGNFRFRLAGDADVRKKAMGKLVEHLEFGSPADLEVEGFELTGSPTFEQIGLGPTAGTVNLQSTPQRGVVLRLVAGEKFQITSPTLDQSCLLYRGTKGFSLRPEGNVLIGVTARFEGDPASVRANFNVSVRHDVVGSKPLSQLTELAELQRWAQAVLDQDSALVVVKGLGGKMSAPVPKDRLDDLLPVLNWVVILGQAHSIARFVDSEIKIDSNALELSQTEYEILQYTYSALRGERVRVPITQVGVERFKSWMPRDGEFIVVSTIAPRLGGVLIGEVPVKIGLRGFRQIESDGRLSALEATEASEAWLMFYDESGDLGGIFPGEAD